MKLKIDSLNLSTFVFGNRQGLARQRDRMRVRSCLAVFACACRFCCKSHMRCSDFRRVKSFHGVSEHAHLFWRTSSEAHLVLLPLLRKCQPS